MHDSNFAILDGWKTHYICIKAILVHKYQEKFNLTETVKEDFEFSLLAVNSGISGLKVLRNTPTELKIWPF